MGDTPISSTPLNLVDYPQQLLSNVGTSPTVVHATVYHGDYPSDYLVDVEIVDLGSLSTPRVQESINYNALCHSLQDFLSNSYRRCRSTDQIEDLVASATIFPEFELSLTFKYQGEIYDVVINSDDQTFDAFMSMKEDGITWTEFFRPTTMLRPCLHTIKITKRTCQCKCKQHEEHDAAHHIATAFSKALANEISQNMRPKDDIPASFTQPDGTIVLTNNTGGESFQVEANNVSDALNATMTTTADYIKNMVEPTSPIAERPQPAELTEEDIQRKLAQQTKDREDLRQALDRLSDIPVVEDVSEMGEPSAITPDNTDIFSTEK